MGSEPLPPHCSSESTIVLSHKSNLVSKRVQNDISIGLLEAKEDVHHLDLPLHDKPGVRQQLCCRVAGLDYAVWIFGDVHGSEEVIL
jgi:hypothetical protein